MPSFTWTTPGAQVRVVERDDGVIELHPLASIPADQRWFWTERWQRMEREADEDIAAGRLRSHQDVDDLLAARDRGDSGVRVRHLA